MITHYNNELTVYLSEALGLLVLNILTIKPSTFSAQQGLTCLSH